MATLRLCVFMLNVKCGSLHQIRVKFNFRSWRVRLNLDYAPNSNAKLEFTLWIILEIKEISHKT